MDLVAHASPELTGKRLLTDASRLIMQEAMATAGLHNVRELRFLIQDACPSIAVPVLREQGFEPAVSLQSWSAAGSADHKADPGVQHVSLRNALSKHGHQALRSLIADCLDGSEDLQALTPPDPEALLVTWIGLPDAELLLAGGPGRYSGLAVLTHETEEDALWSTTLQYLGVARLFRRCGWGRRLLRQVRAVARSVRTAASQDIIAWCDTSNTPAVNLYRDCGFVAGDRQTIWLR